MDDKILALIVSLVVAILGFLGNVISNNANNKKSTALIIYRVDQLEKKVDKHNQVIERTYQLEKRCDVYDERFKHLEKEMGRNEE